MTFEHLFGVNIKNLIFHYIRCDRTNFGPQSKNDVAAFAEFFKALDNANYSKTFTRVLIKRY